MADEHWGNQNYWKPFSEDVTKLVKAGVKAGKNIIKGKSPWADEKKPNEPAYGKYPHNSPARPL